MYLAALIMVVVVVAVVVAAGLGGLVGFEGKVVDPGLRSPVHHHWRKPRTLIG